MEIKYYYKANNQEEINHLLKYCKKTGFKVSDANYPNDFEDGYTYVGVCHNENDFYATDCGGNLLGELTTDIEVFKSQFKAETELERVQRSLGCKYFVVKRDYTQDWKGYINWINKINNHESYWLGNLNYYGYDGDKQDNGVTGYDELSGFKNNPKVFTAAEIMKHINGKTEPKELETKEQLIAQRDELDKRIKELEAEEPVKLTWCDKGIKADGWLPIQLWSDGQALWMQSDKFDFKIVDKGNHKLMTLHKKQL